MKLLVIFTGGTIGCTVKNGYISTDNTTTYQLLDLYRKKTSRQDVCIDSVEPYTLLSENLTGDYIRALGECLRSNLSKEYDGIIITHGTDTIQYSAAALSYAFPGLTLPVLLVSSNLVLDDENANGVPNFDAAVEFIAAGAGNGVFVPYRNNDGVLYIHQGNRLLPHLPYCDDLVSMENEYYAIFRDGIIQKNPAFRTAPSTGTSHALPLPATWNSQVRRVFPYPGMEYPSLSRDVKAVLLDTYHSGTLCSISPDMTRFYAEAYGEKIPVFLTGSQNGLDYESVKEWKKAHVITLPPASPIAMYIKLWMTGMESTDPKEMETIMNTPIAGDFMA